MKNENLGLLVKKWLRVSMVSDRTLNQVQGHSSPVCPLRQTLFAGKGYTQKSNFSSALAHRKNHTIRNAACKYRKLQGESLDLISFSYEFKEGIGCSHWVLTVLLLLKWQLVDSRLRFSECIPICFQSCVP